MATLEEIFDQAKKDTRSAKLFSKGYQSVSLYDVKIIKDDYTHKIEILNTSKLYYEKLSQPLLDSFEEYGWRYGVYEVTLTNTHNKIGKIENEIRDEINGKNSEKTIRELKAKSNSFMSKYTRLKNKLNEIRNNV
jgi:hypothetical protein